MNIHIPFQVSRAARNSIFAFFILIANLNASVWPTAIWEREKPDQFNVNEDQTPIGPIHQKHKHDEE